MKMYILGISCFYHDASACIVRNGKLIAAAQEERFTRKKHDSGFPANAIRYCLKEAGIGIDEVNYVGFYEKPLLKFERVLYQHLEMFPRSFNTFVASIPSWFNEKLRVIRILKKKIKYKGDVLFVDHHMTHAAGSFLISPFNKAAVLSIDGVGEWTTTVYGMCEENDIHLMKEIKFPHSIGLLYSTITAYLGFSVNNSEYKVMGLSAYGDMNKDTNLYYKKLRKVIDIKDDGSYFLDMSYFVYHYKNRMPSEKLCKLLGGSISIRDSEMTKRHKDIAAALQLITEDVGMKILNYLYKETKCENLALSGGVALNSVFNGKILRNTPFKNIWIQPDPGDGGTSVGVAFYVYNVILNKKRNYVLEDAYLGPGYKTEEIKTFLDNNKIKYLQFKDNDDMLKETAKLIFHNNIVGWFQGRMEWGPRALGARSILSNPCNKKMKQILNVKVKHRERFRPFAPVVCGEDALKYFECDNPIPKPTDFMLMVYPIRKKYHRLIPAVTHADGSGRLQTIKESQNFLYYRLIKEFCKLSGIPILINTSFNIRGEPIVCRPEDAYRCMMGTEIDYLVIDRFLIKRSDNKKDIWDSEAYAND